MSTQPTPIASASPRVPLSQLRPSKSNPRKTFDPVFIAELAANIKKHDVIQPLLVRHHPVEKSTAAFEIICGEQRYRAAKEAGLVDVPVLVRSMTDEEVLEIQIVENLQRRDLTPLEEADGYNALLAKKYSHEKIAEKIGRSVQYVRDRCRLLKLVQGARELLTAKRIETGHAILLSRLSPEDQVRIIREPDDTGNPYLDARRSGGLWEAQRALPMTSEQHAAIYDGDDFDAEDKFEAENRLKAVSVRELQAWIDQHVKLDPTDPSNYELFPEVAQVVTAAEVPKEPGEKPLKVIHITLEHQLPDDVKKVEGPRVYGPRSWVRADGKAGSKTCASSVAGIIVAGVARGEAFQVCIAKKTCRVHYKDEIAAAEKRADQVEKSGKTGAERQALEDKKAAAAEAKAKAEKARFERALPAIRSALAEKCARVPPVKLQDVILGRQSWGFTQGRKAVANFVPIGKSPESFVRHVGAALVVGAMCNNPWRDDVTRVCRGFGVDVAKIIDSANENEAASKAAKKKPAKKAK